MLRWIAVAAMVLIAGSASAQSLGKPGYGGNGCPDGTAAVSLSRDGKTLSFRLSRYEAKAGGTTGKSFDRKTCNVSLPIRVPKGKSVAIGTVTMRGTNKLGGGTSADIRVEPFIAGGRGDVAVQTFTGPLSKSFSTVAAQKGASGWSACGADVNLRLNTSILVKSSGKASASSKLSETRLQVLWRDC